ncbi:hypothetical protein [Francisella philomiragia]|uniref:Uncharacterized protein n=1 Tax=Francisella philomiragia TaxID=28110 RepID=A0A0B6D426_9GAMM|nr:hypothetical protein [Francisella philomiragia]AJI52408.1 hypothetical protein LA55_1287 [Francisella philomiragia]
MRTSLTLLFSIFFVNLAWADLEGGLNFCVYSKDKPEHEYNVQVIQNEYRCADTPNNNPYVITFPVAGQKGNIVANIQVKYKGLNCTNFENGRGKGIHFYISTSDIFSARCVTSEYDSITIDMRVSYDAPVKQNIAHISLGTGGPAGHNYELKAWKGIANYREDRSWRNGTYPNSTLQLSTSKDLSGTNTLNCPDGVCTNGILPGTVSYVIWAPNDDM